jgi:hypothetical protein
MKNRWLRSLRFSSFIFVMLLIIQEMHAKQIKVAAGPTMDTVGSMPKKTTKSEVLNAGFFDLMNNGQVSTSARILRIAVGDPKKFSVPLCIYGGVSNNALAGSSYNNYGKQSNDHLINQFITPLSGLINFSIDELKMFGKAKSISRFGCVYQFGERILTGVRSGAANLYLLGKPYNFLNSYAVSGLYFQTGAWEKSNEKNMGICWLVVRLHLCYTKPSELKVFMPDIKTNGLYTGYSAGMGIDISSVLNMKLMYYRYLKAPEIYYSLPIYQFSINYSMKNY